MIAKANDSLGFSVRTNCDRPTAVALHRRAALHRDGIRRAIGSLTRGNYACGPGGRTCIRRRPYRYCAAGPVNGQCARGSVRCAIPWVWWAVLRVGLRVVLRVGPRVGPRAVPRAAVLRDVRRDGLRAVPRAALRDGARCDDASYDGLFAGPCRERSAGPRRPLISDAKRPRGPSPGGRPPNSFCALS